MQSQYFVTRESKNIVRIDSKATPTTADFVAVCDGKKRRVERFRGQKHLGVVVVVSVEEVKELLAR